jgi:DNA-binding GntR family transcriptional regulator
MNSEKITIDKTPLGQKAASIIRHRIIEGAYVQGSRLIEEKLANEFNISRSCIREAFLILETEGMVKSELNKYTKVLKLKQKEIEDLFLFRMALELLSIETSIMKDCVPLEKMNQLVKRLDDLINSKAINSFEYVETDLSFHEAIVASSQNMYIINIYKSIKYQLMTLLFSLYNKFKEEFSIQGMGQHYKITEFMRVGDIKSAQDFLKLHIQENLDYVIKLNERAEKLKT